MLNVFDMQTTDFKYNISGSHIIIMNFSPAL